jgi:hypothetical protein
MDIDSSQFHPKNLSTRFLEEYASNPANTQDFVVQLLQNLESQLDSSNNRSLPSFSFLQSPSKNPSRPQSPSKKTIAPLLFGSPSKGSVITPTRNRAISSVSIVQPAIGLITDAGNVGMEKTKNEQGGGRQRHVESGEFGRHSGRVSVQV